MTSRENEAIETTKILFGTIVSIIAWAIIFYIFTWLISNVIMQFAYPIFDANGLGFPNWSDNVSIRRRRDVSSTVEYGFGFPDQMITDFAEKISQIEKAISHLKNTLEYN